MQEIDVEKIMEGIRREIKEKGYKAQDLRFADIPLEREGTAGMHYSREEAEKALDYLTFHSNNPIFFPLSGNPVKIFIQKVIRRVFFFVINPAFQFQNKFNSTTVRFMKQSLNYMEENEELKNQIQSMQEQIDTLKSALEAMQKKA